METPLPHYIRRHRQRLGLTQDDLAMLLGALHSTKVSTYERFHQYPSLKAALACHVIFEVPLHELFSGVYVEAKQQVLKAARELHQKSTEQDSDNLMLLYRQESLRAIISRCDPHTK